MDHFIKPVDELSRLIETQAQILYQKISDLPVMDLGLPEVPLSYYIGRHHERKFFSVQTAASLLYRSIKYKGKPVSELVIMDYGAGLGSLFLLAKMIGCKTVIYNDILEDMNVAARIISNYLSIPIDHFIAGGHETTLGDLKQHHIQCDIILSRNVVEHIYDLDAFYGDIAREQPNALIYFSTTANIKNPALVIFHKRVHAGIEPQFKALRSKIIKEKLKGIEAGQLEQLSTATRGLALQDLDKAIGRFAKDGTIPDPQQYGTNTCNPENGSWEENLLPLEAYEKIITSKGYKMEVLPAFWDTHNSSAVRNLAGRILNIVTGALGRKLGLISTPFIYIIAEKK
jgi:2-polyprenyl-3-methyl-5-hydroxy-6-metoxy-1,4-benzoquinol methylase